jgi:hypothetical protein
MKTNNSINDRWRANSYTQYLYLYSKDTDLNVKTSIDLIVLSCEESEFKLLDEEFKKYYKVNTDHALYEGNFKRRRVYENSAGKVDLLYRSKRFGGRFYKPMFLIYLHQPSRSVICQLHSIFKKLGIVPLVKKIELAWDFYIINVWGFQGVIEQHLFLKYQRSPSFKYKNTFYTNDLRKSVKGLRVYPRPKDLDYKDCVRVELEIQRSKIKQLGIDFPIQPHHLNLDFRNYFEFRKFDLKKLYNYFVRDSGNRRKIAEMNRRRAGLGQLVLRHIEEWIRGLTKMPLMEAVEELKSKDYGIPNYSRFLVPMGKFNMLVQDAADTQEFGIR